MLTKTYKENLGLSWNPLTVFVAAYIIEELLLDGKFGALMHFFYLVVTFLRVLEPVEGTV